MFSTSIRAIFATSSLILSGFIVFTFTDIGNNLAAVITGVQTNAQKCIQALGDEIPQTDYQVTKIRLNNDSVDDYVLQATTKDMCGSMGCIYELCILQNGHASIIPFGYAGETLTVKNTLTNGMQDIQLAGKSTTNLQWNGLRYIIAQ